ncbi:MAG: hypothetical protein SFV21_15895 [Rhodospirillaceae bacterium]|nr:hypothetical protein [Rhodospirillaceae bacterium]
MFAASGCGIDPYLAAEAGEDATPSLRALRHALTLPPGPERTAVLAGAARELNVIDPARHGALVDAIAEKIAAARGKSHGARRNPRTGQQEFGLFGQLASNAFSQPDGGEEPPKPENSPDCPEEGRLYVELLKERKDDLLASDIALRELLKLKGNPAYQNPQLQSDIDLAISKELATKAFIESAIKDAEPVARRLFPQCFSFVGV